MGECKCVSGDITEAGDAVLHALLAAQDRRNLPHCITHSHVRPRVLGKKSSKCAWYACHFCRAAVHNINACAKSHTSLERGVSFERQPARALSVNMSVCSPSAPYGEQKLALNNANICKQEGRVRGIGQDGKKARYW